MSTANYLTTAPLQITQATLAAEPSLDASITFTDNTGTSIRVVDVPDGVHEYSLVVYDTSDPGGVESWRPADGTEYANGTTVDGTKKVINLTYASNYNITGLTENTTYYFRVYPYNGSGVARNYRTSTSGVFNSTTTASAPTVQAAFFNCYADGANVISSTITANTPAADGYVIYRKGGSYPTTTPVDGSTPSVDTSGTTNTVCIYVGGAGDPAISRTASRGTTYYYRCYAYNGTGSARRYNTTSPNESSATESDAPPE